MFDPVIILLLSVGYLFVLFLVAFAGDNSPAFIQRNKHLIVSLSLAINCSAWAFYGTTGQAVTLGWYLPPTFLGGMVLFLFGFAFIRKLIARAKQLHSTSIADFVASRHSKSQPLAMLVTVVALCCLIPYVAIQLKAVAVSFNALTQAVPFSGAQLSEVSVWRDTALYTGVVMGLFAIFFGTRHIDSTEHHDGLMLAIAFESLVKLFAFVALGVYAAYSLHGGLEDLFIKAASDEGVQEMLQSRDTGSGYLAAAILGMVGTVCLPRHFHVLVVESREPGDARSSRWVFPLYLLLMTLPIVPIAYASMLQFAGQPVSAENFVLALPVLNGHQGVSLLAYIGGLSAGSSMVIVAAVALATMICNEIVMPLLWRNNLLSMQSRSDVSAILRLVRRLAICFLLLCSYIYYRWIGSANDLGATGLLAFALIAQVAPSVIGAVYLQRCSALAAITGISAGFLIWAYTLLVPTIIASGLLPASSIPGAAFAESWLAPGNLLNWFHLDAFSNGVFLSLIANTLCYFGINFWQRKTAFTEPAATLDDGRGISLQALYNLTARFIGPEQTGLAFQKFQAQHNLAAPDRHAIVGAAYLQFAETLLSGVIGAVSARHVLNHASNSTATGTIDSEDLLEEASQVFQYSRDLLQASIDNINQGISVVDNNLRMVAWNKKYLELFGYPANIVHVGVHVADLIRYNARNGEFGAGDIDQQVQKRLDLMQRGSAYNFQRTQRDGSVLEIQGCAMPGGGFVTTYTDITAYHRILQELQDSKSTLEKRIDERTAQLQRAKQDAEQANRSKTRFLAEASHDLIQPLNASRLFLSTLQQRPLGQQDRRLVEQLALSLQNAEALIEALFGIAKIDAGAVVPELAEFPVMKLLDVLRSNFSPPAQAKGIELRVMPCGMAIRSDYQLLYRVLQNLVSNAIRYTRSGRVVVGCRRAPGCLRIQVWDSGSGIAEHQQQEVFLEFKRLENACSQEGSGLGLASVKRLCTLLQHPLSLESTPGKGSLFQVQVPLGTAAIYSDRTTRLPMRALPAQRLDGLRVLSIDNDPGVLRAMEALLTGWGCQVSSCRDKPGALAALRDSSHDIVLADYHLDAGGNGIDLLTEVFCESFPPCIIVSADQTDSVQERAHQLGFLFLAKPLKPAALRASINRLASIR